MSKETTYQRLKRENELLGKQLREVVMNPNSMDSLIIKNTIFIENDLENAVWFGSAKAPNRDFERVDSTATALVRRS